MNSNGDYSELIEYLDKKFSGIDREFKEVKEDFNNLQVSVDAYAKKADDFFKKWLCYLTRLSVTKNGCISLRKKSGLNWNTNL